MRAEEVEEEDNFGGSEHDKLMWGLNLKILHDLNNRREQKQWQCNEDTTSNLEWLPLCVCVCVCCLFACWCANVRPTRNECATAATTPRTTTTTMCCSVRKRKLQSALHTLALWSCPACGRLMRGVAWYSPWSCVCMCSIHLSAPERTWVCVSELIRIRAFCSSSCSGTWGRNSPATLLSIWLI